MPKIMLVEDDNNLREIYGERLMAEGYDIIAANDGEEALALAVKEKPDLIISDVMMPKISGFDMLDILRQTPETKDTKVIMMTALSQTEDKDRADKLGADKYLVKSQVTLEDVARVVKDMLYGTDTQASEVAAPAEPTAETAESEPNPEQPPATNTAENPQTEAPAPETEPNNPEPNPAVDTPTTPDSPPDAPPASVGEPSPQTPPAAVTDQPPAGNPAEQGDASASNPETTVASDNPATPIDTPEPAVEEAPPIVNPISGDTTPHEVSNTNSTDSASANSTEDEVAKVNKTIDEFLANNTDSQTPEIQAPLIEPSQQEQIHAQNASEEPTVKQPAVDSGILDNPAETAPPSETDATAPPIKADPTVPPIMGTPNDIVEPASARKGVVIQPLNDLSKQQNDINKLYEEELAKENAETPVTNPESGEVIDTTTQENPITSPNEPQAPLETADTSQISGLTYSNGENVVEPPPEEPIVDDEDKPSGAPPESNSPPANPSNSENNPMSTPDQIAL